MKNYYYCVFIMSLLFAACSKPKQNTPMDFQEPAYIQAVEDVDNSIHGVVITVDDEYVTVLTYAGDSCRYNYISAKESGKILGGIYDGDEVILMPGNDDNAESVLNLTALHGDWVYKNVAEEDCGIQILDGGKAKSINHDSQFYQSWSTYKNKLLLGWISDGSGASSEIIDTCDVNMLTTDTLKVTFHFDADETRVFTRRVLE